ncbi:MAG TPA: AIR synthase-related protein [Thermomicrobiales bacterium]|nr:AIR synthase-related protein [Thermomicrobiales bacterium]
MSVPDIAPILAPGKLPGPLLERLIESYRTLPDPDVLVPTGYGRDAAALLVPENQPLIVKSDPITFATSAAARYLVAVNANDIACLGGRPRWLTVVMLVPVGTLESTVEQLFADLQNACDALDIAVIGGHSEVTAAVSQPVLVGTMLGVAGPSGLLEPGGAKVGDDLMLTQMAGIEGTALLARERTAQLVPMVGADVVSRAAKLLQMPGISVVRAAEALLATGRVRALHDPTEGGVATAIHELAAASGCGVEVLHDAIPVLPETRLICEVFGLDPLGLLGSGALLVAVSPADRKIVERAASRAAIPISHVGRLVDRAEGSTMLSSIGRVPLPRFDADEVTRVL